MVDHSMLNKNYDATYLERLGTFFKRSKDESYAALGALSGKRIADVGCGPGKDALFFARAGAHTFGFDHDPVMIAKAQADRSADIQVSYAVASADSLPLENGFLDVIRYDRVFQHTENHRAILNEARRTLRSEGVLQILDTDYLSFRFFLEDVDLERKIVDCVAYERIPNGCRIRSLPAVLRHSGFKVESLRVHSYVIEEFEFANYVIRFDKAVDLLSSRGSISSAQQALWLDYTSRPSGDFFFAMDLLLIQARPEAPGRY